MNKGIYHATLCSPNSHTWTHSSNGTVDHPPPETRCDCGSYRFDQIHLINDVPTGEKAELFEWMIGAPIDRKEEANDANRSD